MSLLAIVLSLVVVGVLLWLLNKYGGPYIDGKILQIINVVVVVVVVVWLLKIFGVWAYLANISI